MTGARKRTRKKSRPIKSGGKTTATKGTRHIQYIGGRDYQEDRFLHLEIKPGLEVLMVADGHGGEGCSTYVAANVARILRSHWPESTKVSGAMETCLKRTMGQIVSEWDQHCAPGHDLDSIKGDAAKHKFFVTHGSVVDESGSTIAMAVVDRKHNRITSMSLGDSRVAIRCNGRISETVDHAINSQTVLPKTLRGFSLFIDDGRLNGNLAMHSAIGDNCADLFGVVARKPVIHSEKFIPGKTDILVATDGVFDDLDSQTLFGHFSAMDALLETAPKNDNATIVFTSL